MAGNLDLDSLSEAVGAGSLDTVLVCFTDVQRQIGERVTARTPISSGLGGGTRELTRWARCGRTA